MKISFITDYENWGFSIIGYKNHEQSDYKYSFDIQILCFELCFDFIKQDIKPTKEELESTEIIHRTSSCGDILPSLTMPHDICTTFTSPDGIIIKPHNVGDIDEELGDLDDTTQNFVINVNKEYIPQFASLMSDLMPNTFEGIVNWYQQDIDLSGNLTVEFENNNNNNTDARSRVISDMLITEVLLTEAINNEKYERAAELQKKTEELNDKLNKLKDGNAD